MSELVSVLIGVVSSLVATFIFLFMKWCIVDKLIPWFLDKTYKGIRVDGFWSDREEGDEGDVTASLQLKQESNRISGTYSHAFREDISSPAIYKIEGEIRDSYIAMTCWPVSKDHLDAFTMLFKVYSKSGLRMKGIDCYISHDNGGVAHCESEYRKVE